MFGGWRHEFGTALFPLVVFLPGTAVAAVVPQYATYVWFLAFGALLIRRLAGAPTVSGA
ncbi:hypothetical protein QA640_18255 [Bradyrhizobium sp. CB82]|uniref:hypothetical protein n=1 Tax=Bradyrhizobium sp. CB82 TaxID=3039159 RepID=UPI0024B17317|nr:hypothetical protein [Bradyrhizobium sp. CB82]WFU44216.1 hypothetical protein QA640_18255 [Bradyrhizobium sp. CB82]